MKKIFAFVLASLMVLSLVPASAFAAVTKCPATHTSTNCDATLLYTAVADCENVGYQAYVCNDCGAQFMDNMKPKTNHAWVSDTDLADGDVAANCIYKAYGVSYLICKNCDKKWTKTVDYNSVDVHDLKLVSGVGCEKLYECNLCGAQGYIGENAEGDEVLTQEVSHAWEFVQVESDPVWNGGKLTKGVAVYSCEDCVATKKVDITIEPCHESNDPSSLPPEDYKVIVNPKNATCTAKGNRLVVQCTACAEYWYCNSKTCATDHKEYEDHNWASADTDNDGKYNDTDKDAKHSFNALGHLGAPSGVACGTDYYCTRCYTWQETGHRYEVMTNASTGEALIVNPTCTTKGYVYQQCIDCYYIYKNEGGKYTLNGKEYNLKATGHSESGWQYVDATCKTAAYRYKYCKNWNCTITPTMVDGEARKISTAIQYIGSPNPNGHNLQSVGTANGTVTMDNPNPEIYCNGFTYEFKYCTNGCAEYGTGKAIMTEPRMHDLYISYSCHNFSKAKNFAAFSTKVQYACKYDDCTVTDFEYKIITDTTLVQTTFNSASDALEFFGYTKRSYTYNPVTEEVELVSELPRADYESYGTAEAIFAAKFVLIGLPSESSCVAGATKTYAVSDYGTYITIVEEADPHQPGKMIEGTPATCLSAGTHDTYVCKNCGVTYWEDKSGNQYTTSPVKNPCSDTVEKAEETSCAGATEYWVCTSCNTCYTDATCSTKCLPVEHAYVTLHTGVAANCNETGIPEVRYCSVCKAIEVNLIYMNGGNELRVNFPVSETETGYTANIPASWLYGSVISANDLDVNIPETLDSVTFMYDSDDAEGKEEWTTWPSVVEVKKMESSSNHQGFYVAVETEGEDEETVVNYVLATGIVTYDEVTLRNSEDEVATGFETLDHTKPSFTLVNCEACVYEYIKDYIAAPGGHINDDNNIITDDCADGAKGDRVCKICYNYYLNNEEYANGDADAVKAYADLYTFGEHTTVDASAQTGFTCQSAGYTAELCTKCNLYIVKSESYEPANADKFHKELKAKIEDGDWITEYKCRRGVVADYANNGNAYYVCYVCEKQLIASETTPCPGTGLEINMSTEYDEYMPNSYIELVISLDSLKGVNVWGLNFSVGYNPDAVEFVKADFTNSPFGTNKANAVEGVTYTQNDKGQWISSTAKVAYGVVSVASSSTAGVDLKGNNEYAVLTFKVIESGYTARFSIGYIQPCQTTGYDPLANTWYKANAVGANGRAIKVNYNVTADIYGSYIDPDSVNNKNLDVNTLTFLDLDESGELDIFDAFDLYYLIETDTYSVLADADHDGDVDTDDLDLLYAVLVGETTLKDILKGETEGEEDREIVYDENGFIVYDSLYDLNEDGVLSAYEIAVMTGKIDADLNPTT